jgi:tRNA uridine 5-carboxymethylaminomethyl modification enzyme
MGLVDDGRWESFNRKRDAVSRETERLKSIWVSPKNLPSSEAERVLGKALEHEHNLYELLRRPGIQYADLMGMNEGRYRSEDLDLSSTTDTAALATVVEQIEISTKYAGYIHKQQEEVGRTAHYERLRLPPDLDYMQVSALSFEVRQKLNQQKPETLGLASRISGVTPAAVSLLLVHLKKTGYKIPAPADRAVPQEAPQ